MPNGPAIAAKVAESIRDAGEAWGDPFEISTIRRDDYAFGKGDGEMCDVVQCNNAPSTMTPRGHQVAMAFMSVVSGINKHGLQASDDQQVHYVHLDVAGSAEEGSAPGLNLPKCTGSPITALSAAFLH